MTKARGRMLSARISDSDKFAKLSPEAAVLFVMMIPHFNAHGKLNGGSGYIKDEVCPKVPYLTYEKIPTLLAEISQHTNVKYFQCGGRWWVHSLNFLTEHQTLSRDRLGEDSYPSWPGESSGVIVTVTEEPKEPPKPPKEPKKQKKSETEEALAICISVMENFNSVTGQRYQTNPVTKDIRQYIMKRIDEGFTLDDFIAVNKEKTRQWLHDPEMRKFLRPHTLYSGKFQAYLQEARLAAEQKDESVNMLDKINREERRIELKNEIANLTRILEFVSTDESREAKKKRIERLEKELGALQ